MRGLGITQQDLSAALSCTRGAVGHYLSGRRTPSLQQLEAIAGALDTSPAWLLYGGREGISDAAGTYGDAHFRAPILADTAAGRYRRATSFLLLPSLTGKCYAVSVGNSDFAPRAWPGECLLVDPLADPAPGDEVFVIYRNGSTGFHAYLDGGGGRITLDSVCGARQPLRVAARAIKSLHRVIAIVRGGIKDAGDEAAGTT